jgi:hypothetical protein
MIHRTTFALFVAIGISTGCKRNSPEQVAAAHQAADAYCACVQRHFEIPVDQLADLTTAVCETESKAFQAAWAALPVGGQDPAANEIHGLQSDCHRRLSDLLTKYRRD